MVERGTKRKCSSCGASYYDLNRTPIACPKCDTPYVAAAPVKGAPLRGRIPPPPPPAPEEEGERHEEEREEEQEDAFEAADELPSDDGTFAAGEESEDRD